MNKTTSVLLAIVITANLFAGGKSNSPSVNWHTDFNEAQESSIDTEKPILIAFTGSDWCRACMKLKKEQFENDLFQKFAAENLILVLADFPRSKKHKLSPELIAQNDELAEKYNPKGTFPYLVIVDGKGKVIAETGYINSIPEVFIKDLELLMKQKGEK